MRTRAVAAILLVGMTLTLSGCNLNEPLLEDETRPTEDEMKRDALAYMETRYGVPFEFDSFIYGGAFNSRRQGIQVTSPQYPDMHPESVGWKRVDGVDVYGNSSFLYYPMSNAYLSLVKPIIDEYFPTHSLETSVAGPAYPDSFDKDTTVREFYEWARNVVELRVVLAVPHESSEGSNHKAVALETDLRSLHSIGSIALRVLDPLNYQLWVDYHSADDRERFHLPYQELFVVDWGK